MRCFGFVFAIHLIACSTNHGASVDVVEATPDAAVDAEQLPAPSDADAPPDVTDAPVVINDAGPPPPPPDPHFTITSPVINIDPHTDVTYCYYVHTGNTEQVAVKKWESHLTGSAQQLVLYQTPTTVRPDGLVLSTLQAPCGMIKSGPNNTIWTYSADTVDAVVALPSDDGKGVPVGQVIKAGQPTFVQMHFVNTSDLVQQASVVIIAHTYESGVVVTPAAPFVATNIADIKLAAAPSPDRATMLSVGGSCSVDPAARFYLISTHTFKQGIHTSVKNGTAAVFDGSNWQDPGATSSDKMPFLSFSTGMLAYQCDYKNPNGYSIIAGDNAATDEMCVAIGYYFPATETRGHFCLGKATFY